MTETAASADRYPDFHIPKILRWWDGGPWTAFAASVEARAVSARAASAPTATRTRAPVELSPARIPELVRGPSPRPGRRQAAPADRQKLEAEVAQLRRTLAELGVTERDRLWMELADLNSQIPAMRHERDQLQTELADLNNEIPTLGDERNGLLAEVTPLRAELVDLRSKQSELKSLKSEIRTLRHQKSSLDRELLAEIRGTSEKPANARSRYKFDDS
jgi:prefoldin subunit 5